jgi:hypothetical protein
MTRCTGDYGLTSSHRIVKQAAFTKLGDSKGGKAGSSPLNQEKFVKDLCSAYVIEDALYFCAHTALG